MLLLKRFFFIVFVLMLNSIVSAQNLYLKIKGISTSETKTIDSIGYKAVHINLKTLVEEGNLFVEKLTKIGYIEYNLSENKQINDSTFGFQIGLGKKTDFIHIYTAKNAARNSLYKSAFGNDSVVVVAIHSIENFMNRTLASLEKSGYSLSKINLINFRKKNNLLLADLKIDIGTKRLLNDIVIDGYSKFPVSHLKNIKRLYKNKVFNLENLKKINFDFNAFRFVTQKKFPEILFTKDTTKIYVYLEKSKPNRFDGLLGFSNDKNSNVQFNGYLDLLLINTLNSGESFTLFWKSDGNEQKTFNAALELPYIFKSRFGLKTSLNIFKQDSTFQNTKTNIDVGYMFNYNTRLYLGYQSAESSDIQNKNNFSISDFKNAFTTLDFEFTDFKSDDYLFPEKTKISLKTGLGSRNSKLSVNKQLFFEINLKHNIYLNSKNSFNLKSQNYYLKSDALIINELYRFGGINSIRGFNENSLQANFFSSFLTEYRYLVAPSIYVHTISDYGFFKDSTSNTSGSLLGIGFGFGILTKNGLLNLVYANGSTKNQAISASNSIVHLKFVTNF